MQLSERLQIVLQPLTIEGVWCASLGRDIEGGLDPGEQQRLLVGDSESQIDIRFGLNLRLEWFGRVCARRAPVGLFRMPIDGASRAESRFAVRLRRELRGADCFDGTELLSGMWPRKGRTLAPCGGGGKRKRLSINGDRSSANTQRSIDPGFNLRSVYEVVVTSRLSAESPVRSQRT